jgi:ATP-binding cassette, subfamily F, member 3
VLPFERGERTLGAHVDVHYYAQHQLDALVPQRTVLEELEAVAPGLGHTRLRTILGAFLFSGDAVDKRVAVLSGGEKARLALARMLVRPAALLALDEPTNHLDLASREVLEAALDGFPGTIVFISHDRYFINRLASRVVEVERGALTDYLGSYDDYLEAKARRDPSGPAEPTREPGRSDGAPRSKKRPAAADTDAADRDHAAGAGGDTRAKARASTAARGRGGAQTQTRKLRARLAGVEQRIHELEARLAEIGRALGDPELYRDGDRARAVAAERQTAETEVAWLLREWEELASTLAGTESP